MLVPCSKNMVNRVHDLLIRTGITKAGYLFKRECLASQRTQTRWESVFLILNDHCLYYCSEKHNFSRPDGNLLLTSTTRVYNQDGDQAVIRIETGAEVWYLKGSDLVDVKEWKKAIHFNVGNLSRLARGQFFFKDKGRTIENYFMLHKECITRHPSFCQTIKIDKIYPLTESSVFWVKENIITFKTGTNGNDGVTMISKNEVEMKNWLYALEGALSLIRNGSYMNSILPPQLLVHSGTMQSLDLVSMKWSAKYLVLTEDFIYINGNRSSGFHAPRKYRLTPNTMIFSTSLKKYSFEVVLFSESLHLAASSETEKSEWMFLLKKLIPKSMYDLNDPLQAASLDGKLNMHHVEFESDHQQGIILERRGNWALAAVVSDFMSRKISQGSILSSIQGKCVALNGFNYVVEKLTHWEPPLRLGFWLSPQKMGWLTMIVANNSKSMTKSKSTSCVVYATISTGTMTLFQALKDGKSKKQTIGLYGSAIGLVAPECAAGNRNCFRIYYGLEVITLQADSYDEMMDWSIAIAHGISMENGGGLLLDKAKKESSQTLSDQCECPSIFRDLDDNHDPMMSIIFAKSNARSSDGSLRIQKFNSLGDSKPSESLNKFDILNVSRSTDLTEVNTTFRSLDPVDISTSMEKFAYNFFNAAASSDSEMPIQKLRKNDLSCETIESNECEYVDALQLDSEYASSDANGSALSEKEVIEKYCNLESVDHIHPDDFATLLRCAKVTKESVDRNDDLDFDTCGFT